MMLMSASTEAQKEMLMAAHGNDIVQRVHNCKPGLDK